MIADAYPAPKVPLDADNALDLEQLGSQNLITHVWFPGIETFRGGFIFPNWRGCTAQGEVGDDATNAWPIDNTLEPNGLPITFPNALLISLDQGWVFYSYSVQKPTETEPGPESKRLFFYVGKRPSLTSHLPVPQIRQSHDLALDPDRNTLPAEGVTVSVPPYAAMAKGDTVTLQWRGFDEDNRPRPLNPFWDVQEADIGQTLTKLVGRNEVLLLENGRLELRYHINYASGGESSSALQTLRIVAPPATRLPALSIDEHTGGPLDPARFPNGATLRIALHPNVQAGDILTLYAMASAGINLIDWVRLDPSTLDSGVLTLRLASAWLLANNGKSVELVYQYARPGSVLSSEPLRLLIRRPLELPFPIISDKTQEQGDDPDEGRIDAGDTTSGGRASVPANAVVGDTDTVHLHWGDPGTPGHSVVTTPIASDWRAFDVPKNAIAMHMGAGVGARERLNVFYRVVPNGEPPENYQDSSLFKLKILPFPQDRFPVIQCIQAQGTGGVLSLAQVTDPRGAEFRLARWAYINEGQILNIKVFGKEQYLLKDHRVTPAQAEAQYVESWLAKTYLQTQIGVGNKFKVSVTVSFDEGRTHIPFKDSPELTLSA